VSVKTNVIAVVRKLGLSRMADYTRYQWMRIKNSAKNSRFKKDFPGIILPPPYMVYESFQMDYRKYYLGGREDAEWIASLAHPYITLENSKILDWGCGPARIVRHMPDVLGNTNQYFGTDYNTETIAWCILNIPGVTFSKNSLKPPLPFEADQFQFIYGISILTHLSETNQFAWSNELFRIAVPGGIVLLTTHGDSFLEKLTEEETEAYQNKKVILRDRTKEGHRTFGTFHPPAFMKNVFEKSGFQILAHLPGKKVHEHYISQDAWILKKPV
jgi:SAM-dependent methyltransferase